ncbi:MAG: nicotinate-nucleotide--dimethylbenzimidazole phosphoribosyltransferase [Lachnospiraceae bacterium]|jgi:nicotinate-nucleotide--dimethylbenzimidazole phosphoribosyltransferase|nr:nicotinate-nucleotide--dimethylbenzimidazole phosphoribosyltransferase [Lachnospiraceae bacterium]
MNEKKEYLFKTASEERLTGLLKTVVPASREAMEAAGRRWNSIAKPIGSLGVLERDIIKIAGMTGRAEHIGLEKTALAVMCADHGVTEEGVTQTGQEVTRIVAENFTKGNTAAVMMCRASATDVFPVDIGMLGDAPEANEAEPFVLLDRKVSCGSKNIVKEPAMSREQCVCALYSGVELAGDLKRMGYGAVATGEMGIGNTTPSSALACVLTGLTPEEATGRGAGLSNKGLAKKKLAVSRAVERFCDTHYAGIMNHSFLEETGRIGRAERVKAVITLLSELGGFDIAGLCGLFLGGAVYRIPVLIDGLISSVAALLAVCMEDTVQDFLLASHLSSEPAGERIMEALGLLPPLHLGFHLGEGSGAAAYLPLLKMGAGIYENMSTFSDIHVKEYEDYTAGEGTVS